MRITCTMDIDAPAERVFACVDEPDLILRWVEGAVSHRYTTERDAANPVGQRFVQRLRQGKDIKEFEGTIIAFERPTHFAFSIPSPAYSSIARFRITPRGADRSTVAYSIDVTLHTWPARIIGTLLRLPLGLFVRKQIGRLKRLAETAP